VSGKNTDEKPIQIDHSFRERLGLVLEGDGVSYCYQCGACVGDCPSARFSEGFNPRNIMLAVLYGMKEEVVGPESPIWQCSNCFTCFDRCPQDVKPIEVIIALKNLMAAEGIMPKGVDKMVDGLLNTGRSALVTSATHRRREELGLPPLGEISVEELQKLLEPGPELESNDPEAPQNPGGQGPETGGTKGKGTKAKGHRSLGRPREGGPA
jgi:heterodisulfide reductase subunit C